MLSGDVAGERHPPQRPIVPLSAAAARDHVKRLLEEHFRRVFQSSAPGSALTDALLVTSELVANAIRHGGGVRGFTALVTDRGLIVEVRDRSTDTPTVRRRSGTQVFPVGGYGWPLVQRLATEIDIAPMRDGKSIRVLLPLAPSGVS